MASHSPKRSAAAEPETSQLQLCLRIKHPSLDPKIVTDALEISPEHTARAGLAVTESGSRHLHSESYWLGILPTPTGKELLERAREFRRSLSYTPRPAMHRDELPPAVMTGFYDGFILMCLQKLVKHREFFHRINQEQGSVTLMAERSDPNSTLTVTPALAKYLVDLGIALEID